MLDFDTLKTRLAQADAVLQDPDGRAALESAFQVVRAARNSAGGVTLNSRQAAALATHIEGDMARLQIRQHSARVAAAEGRNIIPFPHSH